VRLLFIGLVVALASCSKTEPAPPSPSAKPSAPAPLDAGSLAVAREAPARVVAIGDLHGDVDAARRALRLAGAIDAKDAWIGGAVVVVQTGDQIDRGDDDREVLELFQKLEGEAAKAGGNVISLSGNHEIMNAMFDFRYVTKGAFASFANVNAEVPRVPSLETEQRGRAAAFAPGGPYAKILAKRPVVARVGDSIFVHGGVLPKHVTRGLDSINDETRAFFLGERKEPPREVVAEDGVVWTRMYSTAPGKEECDKLGEALDMLHAKRMVMGHTVQKPGIQPACGERAWRIDVGLSKFYGGPIQVLEIAGGKTRVLDAPR
jgi:hypothetical protein